MAIPNLVIELFPLIANYGCGISYQKPIRNEGSDILKGRGEPMLVKDLMVSPVITVSETDDLASVAGVMLENRIGCVPVVNARGEAIGVITQSDFAAREKGIPWSLVRHPQLFGQWLSRDNLQAIYEKSRSMTAREVMHSPIFAVTESDSLESALALILREDVNHVLVVNGKQPIGIISRFDLLKLMQRQKTAGC